MAPSAAPLLAPDLLRRLRVLRHLLFVRRRRGELRGGRGGRAPEFDDHRPYVPGDDPRSIDWNAFARFERLLVRLFLLEEERRVCVLLDASASMRSGGGRKARTAARFAAALSYLALAADRSVSAGVFAEGLLAHRGPLRGIDAFPALHDLLASPPGGRGTALGPSAAQLLAAGRGRALLFVVSDLLQERSVAAELSWLAGRREDLHVVQVLDEEELRPTLRGAWTVADPEGPGRLGLHVGQDLLARLAEAVRGHVEAVAEACRRHGFPHALVVTSEPFEQAFFRHLGELRRP